MANRAGAAADLNERYVVERLIDSAAALDYPADRLTIQVLDDSTDDTAALAEARVAFHREQGRHIDYLRRTERTGYKAGALAAGMAAAPCDFAVVFDADFVPPTDYVRKLIPELINNPRLGMLQARWGHLNPGQNMLTRAMALAFDSFFTVDQVARSGAGLMMNFNGSAGILRRTCIEEAGGWQHDTLVEDMDLSYRAQIKGWLIKYRLDVVVPGELPASIIALKQQQYRWAKGATQVLRKLWRPLCDSPKPLLHKLQGLLHLSGYLPHPLMVASLLLSLPVVYSARADAHQLGRSGARRAGAASGSDLGPIAAAPRLAHELALLSGAVPGGDWRGRDRYPGHLGCVFRAYQRICAHAEVCHGQPASQ